MRTGLRSASRVRAPIAAAVTASFQRKRAPLFSAIGPKLERQHDDDPGGGEGVPASEHEHRVQGKRERERDAANHGLDVRAKALSQREQAGEAFGELERADNQHETADVGHAARGDRHCRRVGDKHGGDAEREHHRRRRVTRQARRAARNREPGSRAPRRPARHRGRGSRRYRSRATSARSPRGEGPEPIAGAQE